MGLIGQAALSKLAYNEAAGQAFALINKWEASEVQTKPSFFQCVDKSYSACILFVTYLIKKCYIFVFEMENVFVFEIKSGKAMHLSLNLIWLSCVCI